MKINTTPRFRDTPLGHTLVITESGDRMYIEVPAFIYLSSLSIYILYVYADELGTAVRVTKVSLVNCPEMTIKRSGPVGLWALGDPFGGNVYESPQAVPVRLLFRRRLSGRI